MPYKIQGKVVGEDGFPIQQIAEIKEPANPMIFGSGASVWSDPDTGDFVFNATSPASPITISSNFYKSKLFTAQSVPPIVKLEEDFIVVEGTTVQKEKSNTIWWVLGLFAAAVATAVATGKSAPQVKTKTVVV